MNPGHVGTLSLGRGLWAGVLEPRTFAFDAAGLVGFLSFNALGNGLSGPSAAGPSMFLDTVTSPAKPEGQAAAPLLGSPFLWLRLFLKSRAQVGAFLSPLVLRDLRCAAHSGD